MKLIYNNKEVANNTKNYNELLNKPLLNSKELIGNVSLNDINVYNKKEVDNLIASTRSVKAVTALPSPLVENTMYYVGPDADNNYHVYLVDSALTLIDLGMAREESMYKAGAGIEIDSSNNIMADLDYKSVSLDSEGKIYVPTLEGTKGSNIRPVYLDDGQITPVKHAASGNYTSFVPYIDAGGVMDIGNYIDLHSGTSAVADYDLRLSYDTGATSGLSINRKSNGYAGYIPTTSTNNTVGSQYNPVYVDNGIIIKTPEPFIESNSNFSQVGAFNTVADATTYFKANSPGRIGHVRLVNASTVDGITIPAGWYSFIWSSYFGGPAGTISDSQQRGTLQLSPAINNAANSTYIISDEDGTLACRQLIDSTYINKYTPFTITSPINGSYTNRSVTLPNGKPVYVHTIGTGGLVVFGEGLADVTAAHIKAKVSLPNLGSNKIIISPTTSNLKSILRYFGVGTDGSNVTGGIITTTPTSSWAEFQPLTSANNCNGYDLDVTWVRETSNWWSFTGTLFYYGFDSTLSISGYAPTDGKTIPGIRTGDKDGTSASTCNYSIALYRSSF